MTDAILNARQLMDRAERATGYSDWGDDTFDERFHMAVAHLNGLCLDASGLQAATENVIWLLTDRLRFFHDRKVHPLNAELIERPMFATGEPRSGTTLMHALMSVDPESRALRFWEVMHPSPPPGTVQGTDPRIEAADQEWREINRKMASWLRSHPYNDMLGLGLPEDERTWAFDFRVMTPTAWWRVPMRTLSAGLPTDARAQYRIHKMMLQALQYGRPRKRWVLKGFHAFRLKELFDTYPDATLVWLHRDPVQVAASSAAMMRDIMDGIVGPIDMLEEAKHHLERTRANISHTMSDPMVEDPRILHVRYKDFVADPIGAIRRFYEFSDRVLGEAGEEAMRNYLANNKGDRHGKFEYSTKILTDAGYDLDELDAEFRPFRERFGVERERR